MADVKWIKIATDIFDDEKIMLIEASGDDCYAIITVWFKLLCLAGKQNNGGIFMLNDKLAYNEEMLATIFRMKATTIRKALDMFEQFGMIERIEGVVSIPNWNKHQSLDKLEKRKEQVKKNVRNFRERQKQLKLQNLASNDYCNHNVINCNQIEEDKEIEEEIDTTINSCCLEHKNNIPTLEEVKLYCINKNYTFDVSKMYSYYSSKNWELKDNVKIKNWQAVCDLWQSNEDKFKHRQNDQSKLEDWQKDYFENMMKEFDDNEE